jgi:hypothetical protein
VPETDAGFAVPGAAHVERFVEAVSNADTPGWLGPVGRQAEAREAWSSGEGGHHALIEGESGARVITWDAVLDEHGHPIAVIELQRAVGGALGAARTRVVLGVVALAGVLTALGGWLSAVARRQDREVVRARQALGRLRAGNREEEHRPTGALTAEIERLRQSLVHEAARATAASRELQARLDAAELLLAPGLADRRRLLAQRVRDHRLFVAVGDRLAEEVELVDLSHGHVVVRTGEFSALDLVEGMPARVGWSKATPELRDMEVRRRTVTPAGVEYLLAGGPDLELPGTPSAVRSVAYPRRADRVPVAEAGIRAVVVRDGPGGLPVDALDLSTGGVSVLTPLSPSELVPLGSRWAVELHLPDAPSAVLVVADVTRMACTERGTTVSMGFVTEGCGVESTERVNAWIQARVRAQGGLGARGAA